MSCRPQQCMATDTALSGVRTHLPALARLPTGSSDVSAFASSFVVDDFIEEKENPLDGVRYAKLTAPGPSGFRPEHLKDLLSVPRIRDVNHYRRSLAALHATMAVGLLPDAARWLTRTRLIWQRKKRWQTAANQGRRGHS